ncbi:uncharacterized protein DS421_12g364190 [Arachis hypogaea]|nr:uncharacterized protein DS421_12g364190 [Arachis hypogaea]
MVDSMVAIVDTMVGSMVVEVTMVSSVVDSTMDTMVVVGEDSVVRVVVDMAGVIIVRQTDQPKLCRIQSNDHQTVFYTN